MLYGDKKADTIGEKIKKIRLLSGLTQAEFARSIHRGYGTVVKWEQGVTVPDNESANEILNRYNIIMF